MSINGCASDKLVFTHGVPQGSVLGSLLFFIFINDLPSVSKYLTFCLFADDTNIYFESPELSKIEKVVDRELRKVRKWLEANRLALNVDKTNFVIFHSQQRKLTDHIVLKIGNKKIKQESYVKFLGVLLDSNLSWKFYPAELSKKLARTAGLFYKIQHYAPIETLILLYHGISAPFLSYGLPVWCSTYPSLLDSITVLQKRILKIITFNEITAPSGPLFDSLQILKLNDLFQLQVASFVYECINSLAPIYLKIILSVFTLSMVLERAKLGKEICMLSDAILRNMALDQFIILVFAFGTLSLLKSKNQSLYPISGKKNKISFFIKLQIMNFWKK